MADEVLKRDQNRVTVLAGVTDNVAQDITMLRLDPTTKRLLVSATGIGTGSVTSIAAGTGILATPSPITTTGTIALATSLQPVATLTGNGLKVLRVNAGETAVEYAAVGTGSVTSVSVVTANGVSGTVATASTTPAITLSLGAITPSSIAGTTFSGNNTFSGANTFTALPTCSAVPTNGNDLVNKTFVETFAQGLTVKPSCNVATTANVTLSGEQTIDGVLTSTSRILVKNQSDATENGIYVTAAGAWSRATDYDTSGEVALGTFTAILSGTTQANTLWVQTTPSPTLGSSNLVFSQLSSGGTGTVTSVSVVSANGLAGTVATATTTPAITLSCSANGILQSDGTSITAKSVSGSGDIVLATGATLVTPTLGAATATSINKMAITAPATSSTLQVSDGKTFIASNTLTLAGTDGTVMTFPSTSQTVVGLTATQTLTNKAITQRVVTTTDDATAVIDVAVTDVYELSAIANNTTFSFTGSPTDGQKFIIRYKDAGVSKTLTWTGFTAIGVTLPTATTAGKWGYVGVQYNSAASQYHAIAVTTQA